MNAAQILADNFVVVGATANAEVVPVTDTFWEDLDAQFGDFAGSSLISSFSFENDWPSWECHPAGDEFVYLLSGAADMVLALPEGDKTVVLQEPGQFVIVPKGIWHTARVSMPTTMLFVTPGEGTENREHPPRG